METVWFIVGVILLFTVFNQPPTEEQEKAQRYQRWLEHKKWHLAHPHVRCPPSRSRRGCPVCEGKVTRG